ncbi:Vps54-domain-containing protein [Ascodesmis nigricans]|uniref:Vps54-domain-containing protein n=1 Tax=Ascodesmis nigricans TaxID=341454 RepID=A0A4S2MZE2_9PEZI|nr:Vps54-domain-containing protein [Ascodesmis nigricans]
MDWRISKDFGTGAGGAVSSSAISVLVESSNPRASAAARPRPGDIPPVTLTQIPKIKPSAFTSYLSIAPEYSRYQRAKDQGMEEYLRLQRSNQDGDGLLSPSPSVADLTALTDDGTSRGTSPRKGRGRKGQISVTPLSTVPQVYFDPNFHLENPRTFDIVSERSEVIRSTTPAKDDDANGASVAQNQRKVLANNAILQEKLSWYMDTVEVHLVSSISTASSSFFAALGDLRDLHSEAAASVKKIQSLRKELVRLDEEQAMKGLEIVRLRRRRDNVAKLERTVRQMERVLKTFQQAEKRLEERNVESALDSLECTERVLSGKELGCVDLRGVRSLEAVGVDMQQLRYRIGKEFEGRFVECLLSDLRRHVRSVSSAETLRRWAQSFRREQYNKFISAKQKDNLQPPPRSSSLPPEYTLLTEDLRQHLMTHLNGLQRANHVNNAVQAYRDTVIREVKNLIRGSLPTEDDDTDSVASGVSRSSRGPRARDKSIALTRALGPADAEDLFVKIYTSMSELIRRLGTQQKLLLDVTMQMGVTDIGGFLSPRLEQPSFITSPGSMRSITPGSGPGTSDLMDITDLISTAVEISHADLVKIVKLRSEQTARYPLERFIRHFVLNRLFIQECESVCVRVGPGLQNALSGQIKEFLGVYQADKMRRLAESLESDRWGAKELEESLQESIDRIVKTATTDPPEWTSLGRLWELRMQELENETAPPPPPGQLEAEPEHENHDGPENGTNPQDEKDSSEPQKPAETSPAVNGEASSSAPTPTDAPEPPTTNGTSTPVPAISTEPKKLTHAVIDNQRFILPESALLLLRELESYLVLVVNLPGATQDFANSIVEYIKLFNSRTFQLIHGAGATRSAGLTSITTRHLAIASQALSIIITLIPYLRDSIRRHLPASNAGPSTAPEFDRLRRATSEYQSEIHGKLVSIMSDRARRHVTTIKSITWEDPAPVPPSDSDPAKNRYYMDTLCRETGVLYKVLNKHFPVEQVRSIMAPVFRDYEKKIGEGYREAVVRSEEGKKRMLKDADVFRERLGKLEGAGDVPDRIVAIVRGKIVTPGAPARGPG